jgi:hypothetical protein
MPVSSNGQAYSAWFCSLLKPLQGRWDSAESVAALAGIGVTAPLKDLRRAVLTAAAHGLGSLDGVPISDFVTRGTNRGIEVAVPTDRGRHILEINALANPVRRLELGLLTGGYEAALL